MKKPKANRTRDLPEKIADVIIREIKHIPKSLKDKAKEDNVIMRILKVDEIRHTIAHTTKGDLALMLRKDQGREDYRFVLDAVPLPDEKNTELIKLFNGVLFTM